MESLLSLPEVAVAIRVTEQTVRRKIRAGELAGRKVGRRLWVERDSLETYLRGQPARSVAT